MQKEAIGINATNTATGMSAMDFFGAHVKGAFVVFRYFDPFADEVALVGGFCGWSEGVRMDKDAFGVWTARLALAQCPAGSAYKYKVKADGIERYITDPYCEKTDGEPFHNSVFVRADGYVWGDGAFLESALATYGEGYEGRPMHVYELSLGAWSRGYLGKGATYESVARELAVYSKQMGYTHVLITDVFARRVDLERGEGAIAYYAPDSALGDTYAFRKFVDIMHKAGVGVITDCHFGLYTDVYSRNELCLGVALYWMSNYHIDGIRLTVADERECEIAQSVARGLREARGDAMVIVAGAKETLDGCICFEECLLDGFFRGDFEHRDARGLCESVDADSICSVIGAYRTGALEGDEWRSAAGARALTACLMTAPCKKATVMGCELGSYASVWGQDVDWSLLDSRRNAELQLCYADLGEMYLSEPSLWSAGAVVTSCEEKKGVISFERSFGDTRLCILVNLSVNVYEGFALRLTRAGVYDEIFNSDKACYGGSGVTCGEVTAENCGDSACAYVRVPPLAVSVFKLRVQ